MIKEDIVFDIRNNKAHLIDFDILSNLFSFILRISINRLLSKYKLAIFH